MLANTSEKCWRQNVGNSPKNVDEKILEHFRKMLMKRMLVTLPKNIDEKKCWQTFDKILSTLLKNFDEKCWYHFQNMLTKKCWYHLQKMLTKKVLPTLPKNVDEKCALHS
jgi:alpha-galactosidase/6-phospho-beta-glucosidase family protein